MMDPQGIEMRQARPRKQGLRSGNGFQVLRWCKLDTDSRACPPLEGFLKVQVSQLSFIWTRSAADTLTGGRQQMLTVGDL